MIFVETDAKNHHCTFWTTVFLYVTTRWTAYFVKI